MTAPQNRDAIVIGGGTSGLIAAAYLARAGKKVLLLEARDKFGGLAESVTLGEGFSVPLGAQTIYALDPRVASELKLAKHGLRFAVRDMALTALRSDGRHIVLRRDVHATAASIAVHSQKDAEAWPRFRRRLFDLARALRPLWWDGSDVPSSVRRDLERVASMGAAAWLDSWFESDALKAALCFDAEAGGLSTLEPGSALALVWRAAQEMSGLQGATAFPLGGPAGLTMALVAAARAAGAELRTGARVTRVLPHAGTVAGVELESGESCHAPMVFSSVSRRQTLFEFIAPPAAGIAEIAATTAKQPSLGEAKAVIILRDAPMFGGVAVPRNGRFVLAEKLETYAAAEMAARAGELAIDIPMEIVMTADASLAPQGQHVISILVRPVPRHPQAGWPALKEPFARRVMQALESLIPGLSRNITRVEILTPDDLDARGHNDARGSVGRLLAKPRERIATEVGGLFLCGADAEPLPAVSGRAARIAVAFAMESKP